MNMITEVKLKYSIEGCPHLIASGATIEVEDPLVQKKTIDRISVFVPNMRIHLFKINFDVFRYQLNKKQTWFFYFNSKTPVDVARPFYFKFIIEETELKEETTLIGRIALTGFDKNEEMFTKDWQKFNFTFIGTISGVQKKSKKTLDDNFLDKEKSIRKERKITFY
jgi:hypothetical protein